MIFRARRRSLLLLKIAALWLATFGASGGLRALDGTQMQAMVIVSGDEGRGSAFVLKMEGKTFLITNSHVVRGNKNVKFKNLRNAELATGPLEIADSVDAVRAEVTGVEHALELEPDIDKVSIGDAVIVAGNSEGQGVVREIPGKVVGIGPDRIEVDAPFVPGNSGSPILLKSTGKVIGVATYMVLPGGLGARAKSPMSLGEVRRFGFRLDTVAKWIKPAANGSLETEGQKLAEMESLEGAIRRIFETNAVSVAKWGESGFVSKDQARQYPAFAALSQAIEEFAKAHKAAKNDEEKAKNAAAFFDKIKSIVSDDMHGLGEDQFSGFYAVQLKEALAKDKEFFDWYDGTMMPAYRESWLTSQLRPMFVTSRRSSGPPIDPTKLKLVLTDRIAPSEPPDYCHHVTYPAETQPSNLENIFWIVETPKGERKSFPMHKTGLRVRTAVAGSYRVYVEYHGPDKQLVVSTVAEIKIDGAAAEDGEKSDDAPRSANTPASGSPAKPSGPDKKAPPAAAPPEPTSKPSGPDKKAPPAAAPPEPTSKPSGPDKKAPPAAAPPEPTSKPSGPDKKAPPAAAPPEPASKPSEPGKDAPPAPGPNGDAAAMVVGTWRFTYANGKSYLRTIKADGTFTGENVHGAGSWQIVGDRAILTYPDSTDGYRDEMLLPADPKGARVIYKGNKALVAVREQP